MKQKGSSDVKGSLWNHLDKKVIIWHREAECIISVETVELLTVLLEPVIVFSLIL